MTGLFMWGTLFDECFDDDKVTAAAATTTFDSVDGPPFKHLAT
jgi:hypothetical protein